MKKLSLEKIKNIPSTMLITLYCRYLESNDPEGLFCDSSYKNIIDKIDFNFSKMEIEKDTRISVAARTIIFDNEIKRYIKKNPKGTIISLGSGLNVRFNRLDNGSIKWYDVDLPEVVEIRKTLFKSNHRNIIIDKSIFDYFWMNEISTTDNVFIFAEGLFLYFTEKEMNDFFNKIAGHYSNSFLMFDVISSDYLKFGIIPKSVDWEITPFKWSVDDLKHIERFNPNLKLDNVYYNADYCMNRMSERWKTGIESFPAVKDFSRVALFHIE